MVEQVKVGKRSIRLGNVNKTFFREAEISKRDIIDYYERVAVYMVPFLENRPLMMQRFPNGISNKGFLQKEKPDYFPGWIPDVQVGKREGGTVTHVLCNDAAALVYLANQACITYHTWQSKKDHLECPDKIVIDLDPSGDDFKLLKRSLILLKDYLEQSGITSFPMTTGSRGFHVVIPVAPDKTFEAIKAPVKKLVTELVEREPEHFTTASRKLKRGKYIYLDVLRNAYAQTSVAPYTLRAKTFAPVAVPLDWSDAVSPEVHSKMFTIRNIFDRLEEKPTAWDRYFDEGLGKGNLTALEKFKDL